MATEQICDGCGQVDSDPRLHYGLETYHHDCIPYRVLQDVTTVGSFVDGQYVETPDVPMSDAAAASVARFIEIVDACKGGLRGVELRTFIQTEA
jgi:hypothetical protein